MYDDAYEEPEDLKPVGLFEVVFGRGHWAAAVRWLWRRIVR